MRQASRKSDYWRNLWHDYKVTIGMIVMWLVLNILVYLKYN